MPYIQVNIGRNIGEVPMALNSWLQFQQSVVTVITNVAHSLPGIIAPKIEIHTGSGRWWDEKSGEWVSEESAYISVFDAFAFNMDHLRAGLTHLKSAYGQDSIALITESELI